MLVRAAEFQRCSPHDAAIFSGGRHTPWPFGDPGWYGRPISGLPASAGSGRADGVAERNACLIAELPLQLQLSLCVERQYVVHLM